jgi:energy-coupling factor transport system ATP-binding protein
VLGILGANGAGKSTLGAALAGVLPLRAGWRTGAPGGIAFQNPEAQFTAGSVREDVASAFCGTCAEVATILETWELTELRTGIPSSSRRARSGASRWRA